METVLGSSAVGGVHHVGSTAVPGLEAKPIVDILVGVSSLESAHHRFETLEALGYLYAPYESQQMHWFCKPHPPPLPGCPEVGVYKTHGPLDDGWGDVVMVDDELA